MSLQTRLIALVQAIGADIKALFTRTLPYVSDTEPDPAVHPVWFTTSGAQFVHDGEAWFQVLGGNGGGATAVDWANITGKPATFAPSAHNHSAATTAVDGFMSSADKTKLDGVAANATAVTVADIRAQIEAAIAAGTNVTITPAGAGATRTLTVSATGVGGGVTINAATINLGTTARRAGKVVVADAAIAPGQAISVSLSPGPHPGKGTRTDESELAGPISFVAHAEAGQMTVHWASSSRHRGQYAITYWRA